MNLIRMGAHKILALSCCALISLSAGSAQISATHLEMARMSKMGQNTSANWAGYLSTAGNFTAVTGTWTVPQPKATGKAGYDSAWVGIGGAYSDDLIQSGVVEQVSKSGKTKYRAWVEMLPAPAQNIPVAMQAGDSVTVTITKGCGSSNRWRISLINNTSGQKYSVVKTYKSSLSSAEWIEEAPSTMRGILPLDNFGSVRFSSGATIQTGKKLSIAQTNAQKITMADSRNGKIIAKPSILTAGGSGFTVNRK